METASTLCFKDSYAIPQLPSFCSCNIIYIFHAPSTTFDSAPSTLLLTPYPLFDFHIETILKPRYTLRRSHFAFHTLQSHVALSASSLLQILGPTSHRGNNQLQLHNSLLDLRSRGSRSYLELPFPTLEGDWLIIWISLVLNLPPDSDSSPRSISWQRVSTSSLNYEFHAHTL